jgi:hypothetical protein
MLLYIYTIQGVYWPDCKIARWTVQISFLSSHKEELMYSVCHNAKMNLKWHVELKAKTKLSPCLINWALCYEDVWESGGIAPPFLTLELSEGELSVPRPGRVTSVENPHIVPIRQETG